MLNKNSLSHPNILIEPIGDWAGVKRKLNRLPYALKAASLWGQRKAGEKLVKIVKGHIDKQDLGWTPLKDPGRSNDPRVLVDQGTYRDNIKTWQKNYTRYVGVKKGVVNTRGEQVWLIASLHEFKSYNGGPYRALWEPSIEEMGGAKGVANIISKAIENKIRLL